MQLEKCPIMPLPPLNIKAPSFKGTAVLHKDFKEISLSDYRGKYVILFFYPLDFTFVCPTEIIAFSDRLKDFKALNAEVIAVSTDSEYSHLAWLNIPRMKGGIEDVSIPLLSDKSMKISKDYGVLDESTGIPFRGLFIIDRTGVLRQITVNDLPVGRSVDEILRLVQAFQHADEYGEVCPAGWRPGSQSIKPTPQGSQDYFSSKHEPL